MKSERLPGKALMPICGKPVCFHLLDRVCASKHIKNKKSVVVCTTRDKSDDILVEAVEAYGCSVFRGDQDDIIERFYQAMTKFDLDFVIQADGDDPLSATEYMDVTMETLLANSNLDIVTIDGLPLGCATKSFSKLAMKKVFQSYLTKQNDTGFIYFFTKTGVCNHLVITCDNPNHQNFHARLTLDYPEDFDLFETIFVSLSADKNLIKHEEVISFLKDRDDLLNINRHLEQVYNQRTQDKIHLEYKSLTGLKDTVTN